MRYTALTILSALFALSLSAASDPRLTQLHDDFMNPPAGARIMMRWWWFGPSVTKPELERELRAMQQAGIGGVEIQPVYPVALDDPAAGIRNDPYLSPEFRDNLHFAVEKAYQLGLRVDITLGSGWPYGGPHIPITEAAACLRHEQVAAPPDATSIPIPSLENGETLIAAFLTPDRQLTEIHGGRLVVPPAPGPRTVLFFIASRTGQQVKRAAVGAEGFVLDHYDRNAIERHLHLVGDRLLQAFGTHPPYAVFSDSLEVYRSDWTPDMLQEFRRRRGYDLIPYLPALIGDIGEKTADVRYDWGRTLTELSEERYLTPIREWAQSHGTRFRSQTYGTPPVRLSSNALVDLPEGEGSAWHAFSTTRWASSASHLYGRPITSSETWTWLHSPAFRATPLDLKAEADAHFLAGINQLIGHGWPYSPPAADEPGWRFYAAAALNDHNPWWIVMPDLTKYLQRVSYLLRQGKPSNDVALYLPTADAWSGFTAGKVSINEAMPALLGPRVIPAILDAGYNFDFIDDQAIEKAGIPYPVLVLPQVKRMPPASSRILEEFKRRGGIVVAEAGLDTLPSRYAPDFATGNPAVGFVHRKLDFCDVYFIANTGNRAVDTTAHVRWKDKFAAWWDPFSGEIRSAGGPAIELHLEPYESRILVFPGAPSRPTRTASAAQSLSSSLASLDIGGDWKVTPQPAPFYSGITTYQQTIEVPASFLEPGRDLVLNFGAGTPVEPVTARTTPGMRAWLESPVREAAVVYVNGRRAGFVWHPPYEVGVTALLKSGPNSIRIDVGNLAINTLAGRAPPDYKLLNLRYGVRFTPQDMDNLTPLPYGLLAPIHLIAR